MVERYLYWAQNSVTGLGSMKQRFRLLQTVPPDGLNSKFAPMTIPSRFQQKLHFSGGKRSR